MLPGDHLSLRIEIHIIPNWNFEVALFYRNKHRNFFCGPRLSSRQCEIDCFSFPAVLKSPDFSTSFEIVFVAPSAGVQGKVQLWKSPLRRREKILRPLAFSMGGRGGVNQNFENRIVPNGAGGGGGWGEIFGGFSERNPWMPTQLWKFLHKGIW